MTARENARILFRFLREHEMTPQSLVERAKQDRSGVEDLLSDFVSKLHRKNYSPAYISNYLKAVRSWLSYNEIRLMRRIKIGNLSRTPTIEDERVPSRDELRQILNYASERGRCSIALMAFAGLRPQALGDMRGRDGLELRDLPEMRIENRNIIFDMIPTRVVVRRELSKAGHKYLTFLMEEGCEYLKAYLEKRLASGESVEVDSAIISVKSGYEGIGFLSGERGSRHVTTKTVTKEIRDAMRPRFQWRPYVLRAYFDTQLLLAENHGKISHAYRQFFMGHQGDMEARYTTNKGRLPRELIEDMRRRFRDCEEYVSARHSSREDDPELTTIRTMVESGVLDLSKPNVRQYLIHKLGIEDMEVRVAKMRERGLEEEAAVTRTLCDELGIEPMQVDAFKPKDPKKIVSEHELSEYLEDGWDVQTVLPSGRILIQRDY
jgi:integrase